MKRAEIAYTFQGEEEEEEQEEQSQPSHSRQSPHSPHAPLGTPTTRPHQQQLQPQQLNELIEPLAKLNTHTATSPSKSHNQHAPNLRPKELSNLTITQMTTTTAVITNCNNVSPPHINNSTNSNANWNSDSWADGEFEPVDEQLTGEYYSLEISHLEDFNFIF